MERHRRRLNPPATRRKSTNEYRTHDPDPDRGLAARTIVRPTIDDGPTNRTIVADIVHDLEVVHVRCDPRKGRTVVMPIDVATIEETIDHVIVEVRRGDAAEVVVTAVEVVVTTVIIVDHHENWLIININIKWVFARYVNTMWRATR